MNQLFQMNKEVLRSYRNEVYSQDLINIRVTLLLCVFFYTVFGLMDIVSAGNYLAYFLTIRFVYVNPLFVLVLISSFHPSFKKHHQYSLVLAYIAAGVGIILMLATYPENFSYYGGLFLIIAVGHFLTRIYWNYVTLASLMIISAFVIIMIVKGRALDDSLIFAFFYLQFTIICAYGSYTFERFRREKFAQTHRLMDDKVLLQRVNYEHLMDIENANRVTIIALARLAESRDQYTGNHIERVGTLCLRLAKELPESYYKDQGQEKEVFLKTIEMASILHDIGKVAIPEHILMKPGPLTQEEWAIMKLHTIYGFETLMDITEKYEKNNFVNMGVEICRYHHERWDGGGYPEALAGQDIPLSARIVAIVDVYDALISERPYKKAFSHSFAIQEIAKARGKHFDPTITQFFCDMLLRRTSNDLS